ncbi:hypothetical protein HZS_398 [Henneguya salminicola]|nr:hypothetical protein HZS_398 [Henneguya salminicola]
MDIAINFIKSRTRNDLNIEQFWKYFHSTWIIGRTNNSLKRYNRRMNDHFLNALPNICMFVEVIRNKFEF